MRNAVIIVIMLLIIFGAYTLGTQSNNTSQVAGAAANNNSVSPSDSPDYPSDSESDISTIPTVDTEDAVTQSYLYCWNYGPPQPHHLGHPVSGDHLCTNRELGY
jgi:hypothetical protein